MCHVLLMKIQWRNFPHWQKKSKMALISKKRFVGAIKQRDVGLIQILVSEIKDPNMPRTFKEIFDLYFARGNSIPIPLAEQKGYLDVIQVLESFI